MEEAQQAHGVTSPTGYLHFSPTGRDTFNLMPAVQACAEPREPRDRRQGVAPASWLQPAERFGLELAKVREMFTKDPYDDFRVDPRVLVDDDVPESRHLDHDSAEA